MEYRVVTDFTDRTDRHIYRAGDEFPRPGVEVSEERVAELTSTDNLRGEVLIKAVQKAHIQPVADETEKADKEVATKKRQPKKSKKKEK